MKLANAMKTKKAFEWALDNIDQVEGLEDYLDNNFAYTVLDTDFGSNPTNREAINGALFEVPYWALEGSIDYAIDGIYEYDADTLKAQYSTGYYESSQYGDIIEINGAKRRYIASIALPEEMEHQLDSGALLYEYRGPSFLRIWDSNLDTKYPGRD